MKAKKLLSFILCFAMMFSIISTSSTTVNAISGGEVINTKIEVFTDEDTSVQLPSIVVDILIQGGVFNPTNLVETPIGGGILAKGQEASVEYVPNPGFTGVDRFVVAGLVNGQVTNVTVYVTVFPNPTLLETNVRQAVDFTVMQTNLYAIATPELPATTGVVTISEDGRGITFTPADDFAGEASFTVGIIFGDYTEHEVNVKVNVINHGPAGDDIYPLIRGGEPKDISFGVDADGDQIMVLSVGTPEKGTVVINDDDISITYTPNPGAKYYDEFEIVVTDRYGATATVHAYVFIEAVEESTQIITMKNMPIDFWYVINPEIVEQASNGLVEIIIPEDMPLPPVPPVTPINGEEEEEQVYGYFIYTPNPDFVGSDQFTISGNHGELPYGLFYSTEFTIEMEVLNNPITETTDYITPVEIKLGEGVFHAYVEGKEPIKPIDKAAASVSKNTFNVKGAEINNVIYPPQDSTFELPNATVVIKDEVLTYTPKLGFWGQDRFKLFMELGPNEAEFDVEIEVNPRANVAPVAEDAEIIMTTDDVVLIDIVATDADEDFLQLTDHTDPQYGTVKLLGDVLPPPAAVALGDNQGVKINDQDFLPILGPMSLEYRVKDEFTGTTEILVDTFDVTVEDGFGGMTTATVTVTIYPEGTIILLEDEQYIFDDLPLGLDGRAEHGIVDIVPGGYIYIPDADYFGNDQVIFEDMMLGEDDYVVAVYDIVLLPVNDAPETQDVDKYIRVNEVVEFLIPVEDPDEGDTHTFTIDPMYMPQYGIAEVLEDGTIRYTPHQDSEAADSFGVIVEDEAGEQAFVEVTILIPINDLYIYLDEDEIFTEELGDIDIYDYVILEEPLHGELKIENGIIIYKPEDHYNGFDKFEIEELRDGQLKDIYRFEVEIYPQDDAPIAVDDSGSVIEGEVLEGNVLDNDIDIDADPDLNQYWSQLEERYDFEEDYSSEEQSSVLRAELVKGEEPEHGTLTFNEDGSYTYTADPGYEGEDSFQYIAYDGWPYSVGDSGEIGYEEGMASEEPATVTITVNRLLEVSDVTKVIRVNEVVTLTIPVLEEEEDEEYTFTIDPENGPEYGEAVVLEDGSIQYTPDLDSEQDDSFEVIVENSRGNKGLAEVTINVIPTRYLRKYIAEDSTFEEEIPDGYEVVVIEAPSQGELVFENGMYTYTPRENYNGFDTCKIEVFREDELVDIMHITAEIYPVDDAPIANPDSGSVRRDRVLNGNVLDNDVDIDADPELNQYWDMMNNDEASEGQYPSETEMEIVLRAELVEGGEPAHGNLTLNEDGSFTYDPDNSFVGTDSFQYIAYDGLPYIMYDELNETEEISYEKGMASEPTTVTITVTDLPAPDPEPQPETFDDDPTPEGIVEYEDGYVTGYPNGSFKPTQAVTRIEMVTILARILKLDIDAAPAHSYPDVPADHWGTKYLNALEEIGLVEGYTDGTFRPDRKITRAEIATLISRYWDYVGFEADASDVELNDIADHWAQQAINELHNFGLIEGFPDKSYKPDAALLREQLVSIINNLTDRDKQEDGDPTFNDVNKEDNWSYGDIEAAAIREEE